MTINKRSHKRTHMRFDDYMRNQLVDQDYARLYLEAAIDSYEADGDKESFLLALKHVAEAQGGLSKLAKQTGVTRQSLYKTLSGVGNPRFDTLLAILRALNFRIAVLPRIFPTPSRAKPCFS